MPRGYEQNKPLGNWVHAQRNRLCSSMKGVPGNYGRKALKEEQFKKLEDIGFQWRRLPAIEADLNR